MRKVLVLAATIPFVLTSCVSKKKFTALEAQQKETQDLLNSATVKLNSCLSEKDLLNAERSSLMSQLDYLKKNNSDLINSSKEMTVLTTKGAQNLEKSLESLREKDLKITRLQDALTKKDSVTLALVTSLKREVGIDDPDININVEKGVVMISIADNLLFKSGSYDVNLKAKSVLAKVAKVVNSKPDFECMVEGHTDNVPIKNSVLLDNWDLSVKRSTSIVRVLQNDLGVNPKQLIPAGRSSFIPLVENDTAENRAKNRRTRIIIMPKIDQFYDMLEKEMKTLSK
ncbi:OmpA family protein [Flavobacterium sp. F372]|jgi:chemotaxis protein MotB|uniref:OmpA family protein n=1 Tax=Flavobacterium bernardetii TaxID=2813823 RepID=A0ABR7IY87_9FLAO|nr:OmpA family protein [Flavobacterium bernardetii]MBC5834512.1 OmpA family protein [Flavobacterium bernardetii]NHF69849.1 OmpA family protein [Flavobacterium bernardetii]